MDFINSITLGDIVGVVAGLLIGGGGLTFIIRKKSVSQKIAGKEVKNVVQVGNATNVEVNNGK